MYYGVPYQGGKSRICKQLIDLMPSNEYFVDLFGGGGAVTIAAIESGKFDKFIINDIDWRIIKLFENSIKGLYNERVDWISREDFYKFKEKDEWIADVYSFGNNFKSYSWKKEREQWSKAMHYSIFYDDYSLMDYYGIDCRELKNIEGYTNKRRYFMTKVCIRYYQKGLLTKHRGEFHFVEPDNFHLGSHIEEFQSQLRMEKLWNLSLYKKYLPDITFLNQDYRTVDIPNNSTIYCDIPYKNTGKYSNQNFDYNNFYDWCRNIHKNVYISEYSMPQDFIPIYFKKVQKLMCPESKNKESIEKLFIYRGENNE